MTKPVQDIKTQSSQSPKVRGLLARVLTAAVLIPLAVGIVVWGGRAYSAVIAFMVILLIFEWTRIVHRAEFSRGFYTLSGAAILSVFLASGGQFLAAIGIGLVGGALATALEFRKNEKHAWALGGPWAFAGAVYLILPAIAALYIRHSPEEGRVLTLMLFTVVWATDSGAYLFGTFIGGPKLWPSLSPKKTWMGALGGLLCGALTALTLGVLLGVNAAPRSLFTLGLILAIAAVVGDLLESALKRAFGVKDTGGAFPGHGGVLDRLDGFIVAASVLALLIVFGQVSIFD